VLHRCDYYVGSTNERAGITTAFNTFLVGGIIIKWQEIVEQYSPARWAIILAGLLLALTAVASVLSLWLALRSTSPYRPPRSPWATPPEKPPRSVIFFEDVGGYASGEYLTAVSNLDHRALSADLAIQTQTVARAVSAKFADMRRAMWIIVYAELPAVAALVVLKLYLTVRPPQ